MKETIAWHKIPRVKGEERHLYVCNNKAASVLKVGDESLTRGTPILRGLPF